MKNIDFSHSERKILLRFLRLRLQVNKRDLENEPLSNASRRHFEKSYVAPIASAIEKVQDSETFLLTKREKLFCVSCVNEHIDDFYRSVRSLTTLEWLDLSAEQLESIRILDSCRSILIKCGQARKRFAYRAIDPDFVYENIVSAVDKLKKSDRILLAISKFGENDYYKIGFIHEDGEYVSFKLQNGISWRDFRFSELNNQSSEQLAKNRFSMLVDKTVARELRQSWDLHKYPKGVLPIVDALLRS